MIAGALTCSFSVVSGLLGLFAPIGHRIQRKLERKGLIIGLTFGTDPYATMLGCRTDYVRSRDEKQTA